MHYTEIKKRTTRLRRNQTQSEKILWSCLKKRQLLGYKFLRQHAVIYESRKCEHFFFVPDFVCLELKLIIELDGGYHDNRREQDTKRDQILRSKGFCILRIQNEEIIDLTKVLRKIEQSIHTLEAAKPNNKRGDKHNPS